MNRSLAIAFLGACLVVAGIVRADASGPSGTKVGYVDLQRTLNETKSGQKAKKRLEREKAKKQRELDQGQRQLQKFAEELEKQKMVLKPDVLRQREQELQQRYVKFQEKYMKLQQELASREAELVQDIFQKAAPVIQRIAKREGFTMVLEKNESAVLWAADALDITDLVNRQIQ